MRKRTLLSMLAVAPLAACGFQLRQAPSFSFASLYVEAPEGSAIQRALVRGVAASGGTLRVVLPPAPRAQAEAVLHVLGERTERVVLARTASGQVRELELRQYLRFKLTDVQGREWIGDTELLQKRELSYNESLALAKDEEEVRLRNNMRQDLAQQVVRRLSLVQRPTTS